MNEERRLDDTSRRRSWNVVLSGLALAALSLSASTHARATPSNDTSKTDERSSASLPEPTLTPPDRVPSDVRLVVGPIVAFRSMTFEGDGGTIEHRPRPYRGGRLSAEFQLFEFDDPDLALTLEGDLAYASARNQKLAPRGGPKPRTRFVSGGGRLMAYRSIGADLGLGLGVGFQSTSITIEPNRTYTGHRYWSADATIRLRWYVLDDRLSMGLEGAIYPVFATNNSNDAHGPSTSFGVRSGAELAWAPFARARRSVHRGWRLVVDYRYQRFRSQFPTSPIGLRGGISLDRQHRIGLSIGYVIP